MRRRGEVEKEDSAEVNHTTIHRVSRTKTAPTTTNNCINNNPTLWIPVKENNEHAKQRKTITQNKTN